VPFDELLQRLHCLVEELEIPEEWGKLAKAAPSKDSRASVWCEVRESIPSPFSPCTGSSRGLSDSVLRKP
jgi:hypothetical protein